MKYDLKKISDTTVKIEASVTEEAFAQAKHAALTQLSRSVKAPGFRKGKVPLSVAEKHLDPNMLASEAVERAINAAMNEIISAENLRVLDQPKIEINKLVPFTALEFHADVEIVPDIKLADYKKLKAKMPAVKTDKAEVDETLDRIRKGFAERSEVEREAEDGDEVTIDFAGHREDGGAIEGAKGDDYRLELGSGTFIPGFEEQLVGRKAGEKFDIHVTFPKDYHAAELKGAKVQFAIDLKKVTEIKLPPADDVLAKKAGPYDTIKDFRADIERELSAQKQREALESFKDALLDELAQKTKITPPTVLVDDQLKAIERDMMQNLMYRGQTIEQYCESQGDKDIDELRDKELKPAAEKRVRAGLVLAELSRAENITVSKEELDAELARRKEEAPKMAAEFDTPDARRDLANRVVTEKTINRLVELNS